MAGLTLDAGGLIAADHNSRRFWAYWKEALLRGADVTVITPVVAQAWRGKRNARVAQVLDACLVEAVSLDIAKGAGELCGRSKTSDAVDALVIVSASHRGDAVLTSDPYDLAVLAGHAERKTKILTV